MSPGRHPNRSGFGSRGSPVQIRPSRPSSRSSVVGASPAGVVLLLLRSALPLGQACGHPYATDSRSRTDGQEGKEGKEGQPRGRQSPSCSSRRRVARIAASSAWSSMPARTDRFQIACAWLYRSRSAGQSVTWSNRSTAGGVGGRGDTDRATGRAVMAITTTASATSSTRRFMAARPCRGSARPAAPGASWRRDRVEVQRVGGLEHDHLDRVAHLAIAPSGETPCSRAMIPKSAHCLSRIRRPVEFGSKGEPACPWYTRGRGPQDYQARTRDGRTRIATEKSRASSSGVDPIAWMPSRYLTRYSSSWSEGGTSGSTAAVPSTVSTSSPVPSDSRCTATRGLAARLRSFWALGWLKTRNVSPSHRNQTGEDCGWPSARTVVSQRICSERRRRSARAPAGESRSSTAGLPSRRGYSQPSPSAPGGTRRLQASKASRTVRPQPSSGDLPLVGELGDLEDQAGLGAGDALEGTELLGHEVEQMGLVVEERLHDHVVAPRRHAGVADLWVGDQPLRHGLQARELDRDADDGRHGHADRPWGGDGDDVDQVLVDQPGDPFAEGGLGDLRGAGDVGVAGLAVALQQPDDLPVDLVDDALVPLHRNPFRGTSLRYSNIIRPARSISDFGGPRDVDIQTPEGVSRLLW